MSGIQIIPQRQRRLWSKNMRVRRKMHHSASAAEATTGSAADSARSSRTASGHVLLPDWPPHICLNTATGERFSGQGPLIAINRGQIFQGNVYKREDLDLQLISIHSIDPPNQDQISTLFKVNITMVAQISTTPVSFACNGEDCACTTCTCGSGSSTCTCSKPTNSNKGCGSASCTCTDCQCKPEECKC
ncbi:hypothetical protein FA13DRAFT_1797567 [Coprinellus micaceus]|uniref:Uncharacterized protein n=1 Tax=Coprinellus micaceus TaxID=71717 RepID=A0A4Y7SRY0_COPMI|nr:hypothetical protein FA13DRAFT_1797567 [Coprinellus micaceus]